MCVFFPFEKTIKKGNKRRFGCQDFFPLTWEKRVVFTVYSAGGLEALLWKQTTSFFLHESGIQLAVMRDTFLKLLPDVKNSEVDKARFSLLVIKTLFFFCAFFQDSTSLPAVPVLEESEVNNEVTEEGRVSVEHFLQVKETRKTTLTCWQINTTITFIMTQYFVVFFFQELVSDNLMGHTQPVFQFLCPLDKLLNEEEHYGGVWGLLSGLAYFLTPGQEEDEVYSHVFFSSSRHLKEQFNLGLTLVLLTFISICNSKIVLTKQISEICEC